MTNNHTSRIEWRAALSRLGSTQKLPAVFSAIVLSGCEIAGDIFQAGVWVGVILVIGVIAAIVWMISRAKT